MTCYPGTNLVPLPTFLAFLKPPVENAKALALADNVARRNVGFACRYLGNSG